MSRAISIAMTAIERGWVPDSIVRAGMRHLLRQRLTSLPQLGTSAITAEIEQFVALMDQSPIAQVPDEANKQHYEVPSDFFGIALGPHRKYSCCFWNEDTATLEEAEAEALRITCERAQLADGQDILELGCGWGSLTLWMAHHYPNARITAVSNSKSQQAYIQEQARQRGFAHVEVQVCDMNQFELEGTVDRIVSVEMFEHMRNWRQLYQRIQRWLRPDGRLFQHVFCHRACPYPFEDEKESDWMTRFFFAGGIMPHYDLPARFSEHLHVVDQWKWDGSHYEKTCNAWLSLLDNRLDKAMPILAATYGADQARLWLNRWRMFFMACAELFGYHHGNEWFVGHYLLAPGLREDASCPDAPADRLAN